MIRFFKVAFILVAGIFFITCSKDDSTASAVLIPFEYQYPADIANIEEYLNGHYIKEVSADYDVVFEKIEYGNPNGRVSIMDQTDYPIHSKIVHRHDLDYKVYYLNLNSDPDNYGTKDSPTVMDSIFVSYKGDNLYRKTEIIDVPVTPETPDGKKEINYITGNTFETVENPGWLLLESLVQGWKEIIPFFKSGTFGPDPDGGVSYAGFGAGVMFIPSGLGYYSNSPASFPDYSPIVFNFKLKNVRYRDHDQDGILSKDEDINGDGLFTKADDDTDGDGIRNLYDIDDDGDGYSTKSERRFTYTDGPDTKTGYYPYNGAAVNDPSTPYDDTKGLPDCSGDFSTPTRVRRHLDKACHKD